MCICGWIFTRLISGAGDDDNVIAAFKAGRDGLADALRIDDSRFRLHPYLQTKTGGFVLVKMTKGV